MRVRMKVDVSGTRDGREWPRRGSVVDLPDAEAAEYCSNGMAEPVATFADAETAVPPAADVETRADPPLTTRAGPRGKTNGNV